MDDNPAGPSKGSSSPDSSVSLSEDVGLELTCVRFGEAAITTLPALEGVLPPTTEGVKETPFNFLLDDAALIAAIFLETAAWSPDPDGGGGIFSSMDTMQSYVSSCSVTSSSFTSV